MNISKPGSSSSTNPSGVQGTQKRSPTPTGHTFLSQSSTDEPHAPSSSPRDTRSLPRDPQQGYVQSRAATMEGGASEQRGERSSPSISSSQGDMADTEMEAGPNQSSEPARHTPSPPKKKRTRTLTTPHQSAVLHALLAQSRFPTTAMREEVGRAIGLSARKVQIWFQNQRQKARRPRGQNSAPLTRPPQYGPFSNIPPGTSREHALLAESHGVQTSPSQLHHPSIAPPGSMMGQAGPSSRAVDDFAHQATQMLHARPYSGPSALPQLSGPGMPGPGSSTRPPHSFPADVRATGVYQEDTRQLADMQTALAGRPYLPFPPAESGRELVHGGHGSRHSRVHSGDLQHQRLTSRLRLPPLALDPLRDPDPALFTPGGRFDVSAHPLPSLSLRSPSAVDPPTPLHMSARSSGEQPIYRALNIPPPFTLQPRPQWDDPAFSPFSRRHSSIRSGSSHEVFPGGYPPRSPEEAGVSASGAMGSPLSPGRQLPSVTARSNQRTDRSQRSSGDSASHIPSPRRRL